MEEEEEEEEEEEVAVLFGRPLASCMTSGRDEERRRFGRGQLGYSESEFGEVSRLGV